MRRSYLKAIACPDGTRQTAYVTTTKHAKVFLTMPTQSTADRAECNDGIDSLPLLQPMPLSPAFELAMKPTHAWLAAAQMLLADVRDEISNLVGFSDPSVPTTSRQPRHRTALAADQADSSMLDDLVTDAEIVTELEAEAEGELAEDLSHDAAFLLDAKVGSSLDFYLKRLRSFKAPTLEEEQALVRAAQAGQTDAINHLVSRSLPIVPAIARTFIGRGLALEDLIEEGNLGLYRAIPRFNLSLGHRFSTYARWWVKHEIRTAVLNQGRLIRLPIHIFKALSRVRRQLESVGEPMPNSPRSLRGDVETSVPSEALRFTLEEAQVLLKLTELPLSLDMPSVGDPETSLVDTLPSELDTSPESFIQRRQRTQLLTAALAQLAPSEHEVVMRRYGFRTGEPETLQAIGKSLKLTAERVRQIQKQALATIQHHFEERGLSFNELL